MLGQDSTYKEPDSGWEDRHIKQKLLIVLTFLPVLLARVSYTQSFSDLKITSYKEGMRGVVSGFIKSIAITEDSVWFASARGAMRFIKRTSSFRIYNKSNSGIADNYVTGIDVDGKNIWFATANGLSVYNTASNTWKTFRQERGGLSDNYLTCILVDRNYIWIGTRTWGLNRYDKEANQFNKYGEVDGLNSNSITCLAKSGRYIWVGSEGGLNRFDVYSGEWAGYDKQQGLNLPRQRISAVVPDGNRVWVGTISGVYKFDTNEEKFALHSLQSVVFDIVSDGEYLWVATFDGIYRVNKESQQYKLFTKRNGLIDNSISSIAMDSNFLWLGTETPGGGVMKLDKILPQAMISPLTGYYSKNKIRIYGTMHDTSGIRSYSLAYRSLLIGGAWKNAGIVLTGARRNVVNALIGTWNIEPKKVNEETYELKLSVTSGRGITNTAKFSVIVDKTDPGLDFSSVPKAVSKPGFLLDGSFREANMRSIWIRQGAVRKKANIKLSGLGGGIGTLGGGRFSQLLTLRPGKNIIEITAEDIGKHKVVKRLEINYDTSVPKISLDAPNVTTGQRTYKIIGSVSEENLDKIVLQEGNVTLYPPEFRNFKIEKINSFNYRFIYEVTLKPGENTFTFIAQDYANKRGRAVAKITYKTDAPSIVIDPSIATRVRKDSIRIYGRWDDNDLTAIEVSNSANEEKVKADVDMNRKTFSARIKLKSGQNIITVTAIDKAGNVTTVTMSDPIKYITGYSGSSGPDTAIPINPGDTEEIKKIKLELNRLRDENKRLKEEILALRRGRGASGAASGPVIVARSTTVPIPDGSRLYFVPFNTGSGDRLTRIAKDYLGSSRNYGEVAYFNDNTNSDIIKRRRSILVPTKGLLNMIYSGPRPSLIRKAADIIGESYNTVGPGQLSSSYFNEILRRFKGYFGGRAMTYGPVIYAPGLAVTISGIGNPAILIKAMKEKNIKIGVFAIITGNSIIFTKIILR